MKRRDRVLRPDAPPDFASQRTKPHRLRGLKQTRCCRLQEALFAACGEYTAFLNPWWQDVDDPSQFEFDPLGGFLFVYWIDEDCNVCGRLTYKFKMENLVIPKSKWKNRKIFKIEQWDLSAATYITEEALELILKQNFTNFWYRKAGVIE